MFDPAELDSSRVSLARAGGAFVVATAAAVLGLLMIGSGPAAASSCEIATNVWTGGAANGAWGSAGNWSAGHAPTASEHVCINAAGGGSVTVGSTGTAASVEAQTPVVVTGTLTLSDASQASLFTSLSIASTSAYLNGAGSLDVTGNLSWSGGNMHGTGTTRVLAGASLVLSPANGYSLSLGVGRTLINQGAASYPTLGGVSMGAGSILRNEGTLSLSSDGTISGNATPRPQFVNTGTITKTAGITSTFGADVVNDGTLTGQTGKIKLSGTYGSGVGTFTGVLFANGTVALGDGAVLGAASVISDYAKVYVAGTATVPVGATVTMSSTVGAPSNELGGSGTVDVRGALVWTRGNMTGSGTTQIAPGGALTINPPSGYSVEVGAGRTLINQGAANYSTTGGVSLRESSTFRNEGSMSLGSDATISGNYTPRPQFVNTGTVTKTAGMTSAFGVDVVNDGTLTGQTGKIKLSGTYGSGVGTFTGVVFANGTVALGDGAVLGAASVISDYAKVYVAGTATVPVGATVTMSSTVGAPSNELGGSGTVDVRGALVWTRGDMTGSGTTQIAPGGSLTINPPSGYGVTVQPGRTLLNQGAANYAGPGSLSALSGAVVRNEGTLSLAGDVGLSGSGSPRPLMVNTGTVTKTAGTTSTFGVDVVNDGVLEAQIGKIVLGGGDLAQGSGSGTFRNVEFSSGTFQLNDGSTLAGTDTLPGTAVVNVTGVTTLTAGSSLSISSSTTKLGGAGTLLVRGTVTWSRGTMQDVGTTHVAAGGSLLLNPDAGYNVTLGLDRKIVNDGTVTHAVTGSVAAAASTRIVNNSTWTQRAAMSDQAAGGVRLQVVNTGTWSVPSGTTTSCACDYDNPGTLDVAGAYTLTGALGNYDSTQRSLTRGRFAVAGQLQIAGLDVAALSATVELAGTTATFKDTAGQVALRSLDTIRDAGSLTLSGGATLATPAGLLNRGAVLITDTSQLSINGSFTQVQGGLVVASSASRLAASAIHLQAGMVSGLGTLAGPVTNEGAVISPGGDGQVGTLAITGSYLQSGAGRLVADVTSGAADRLAVTGAVTLDGELAVLNASGLAPAQGTNWDLLTYGSRTGTFAVMNGMELPGGLRWWLTDPGQQLRITADSDAGAAAAAVTVNAAATRANSRQVSLTLSSSWAATTGLRIANDTDPSGSFQPFQPSLTWTLGPADGQREVRVQVRDDLGNISAIATDSITLDTTAPKVTLVAPTGLTGAASFSFTEDVTAVSTANVMLRAQGSTTSLPGTLTCQDSAGGDVDCASGQLRQGAYTPTGPLLPGVSYELWVNPAGAATLVHDLAGNAAVATSINFILGPVL